jgi:hypothetical protein
MDITPYLLSILLARHYYDQLNRTHLAAVTSVITSSIDLLNVRGEISTELLAIVEPLARFNKPGLIGKAARALSTTANTLAANFLAGILSLLEVGLVREVSGTFGTTADILAVGKLLARALSFLKARGSFVVTLLARADPFITDLLATALSLL